MKPEIRSQRIWIPIPTAIAIAILFSLAANVGLSQEVGMRISSRETWVGVPVTLSIERSNQQTDEPPRIPDVDGLEIELAGRPARSSRVSIINGRRSESRSVTYTYRITPLRAGTFVIPPIAVPLDDGVRKTEPIRIVASKSETGDLLFAELQGQKDKVYVGQALPVTLKLWLRPFVDRNQNIKLSPQDMFGMISDQTEWGIFREVLESEDGDSPVRVSKVLREDTDGQEHEYYLYEIDATLYPKQAGKLDPGEIRIVVHYPTRLARSRDPFDSFFDDSMFKDPFFGGRNLFDDFPGFGRRLAVADWRPIVAIPKTGETRVVPIPTTQRPPHYRGAVGQYRIVVQAEPTQVKAGDPITLTLGIQGTGPMDLVSAPPLADLAPLTDHFKVPSGTLAGIVQGDVKVFRTTIRPKNEHVKQIPPIPFSFFDPDTESFQTVTSDPISIEVAPAETLKLDSVVSKSATQSKNENASEDNAGPWTEIETDPSALHRMRREWNRVAWGTIFALPPLLFAALWWFGQRRIEPNQPPIDRRSTLRQIRRADSPDQIGKALRNWIAVVLGCDSRNLTHPEAVRELTPQLEPGPLDQLDQCLSRCEQAAFAGQSNAPIDALKRQAIQLVDVIRRSVRKGPAETVAGWRPNPTTIVRTLVVLTLLVATASVFAFVQQWQTRRSSITDPTPKLVLNEQQIQILFDEANQLYRRGLEERQSEPDRAAESFHRAAQKYQTLIDAGVRSFDLYVNLGNARLNAGETGRAIASYRHAQRLRPFDPQVRNNLEWALQIAQPENPARSRRGSFWAVGANRLTRLPIRYWIAPLGLGWFGLWLAWIGQRFWSSFRFRLLSVPSVLLVLAVTSLAVGVNSAADLNPTGVVVTRQMPIYETAGETDSQANPARVGEGESVQILQQRGHWLQIQTPAGLRGWTKTEYIEPV